jgi:hypothetical protein
MSATATYAPTPTSNGAKVTAMLCNERGSATLYRTRLAGPSGQRGNLAVGIVHYIDGNDCYVRSEFEFAIYAAAGGGVQGYARRDLDAVRGVHAWSITREHYDGDLEWIGYADTLSLGVDACVNGIHAATGRHDHRRLSGGVFRASRYVSD